MNHQHTPDTLEAYEWPQCTACTRDLWADETDRQTCRPCEDRAATRLAELPALFTRINTTAALMRGAARVGANTSGSKVPPLPLRLAVLDLAAVGGAATRLAVIEDAWRAALGRHIAPWAGAPGQAVPVHVEFLRINLQWACREYESVGQDLEEIRRLHADSEAALSGEQRPGRVKVGHCPVRYETGQRCAQPLTATAANHRIRCGTCGTRWDDMDAWRGLRRAQEQMYAELATVAA